MEKFKLPLDLIDSDGNRTTHYFVITPSKLKDTSDNYFSYTNKKWSLNFSMVIPDHYFQTLNNKTVPRRRGGDKFYGDDFKKTIKSDSIENLCKIYVEIMDDYRWFKQLESAKLTEVIFFKLSSSLKFVKSNWDSKIKGDEFDLSVGVYRGFIDENDNRYNVEKLMFNKSHEIDIFRHDYVLYTEERYQFFNNILESCKKINENIELFKNSLTENNINSLISDNTKLLL